MHRTASGYKEGSSTVSCDVTIKIKGVGNNYTYSTQNFSWTIYVEAAKVKSIVLSPSNLDIKIGESLQVTANVSPSNAKVNNYSWSTTITKILQVSGNGKIATITGLAVGEAEVICTTDNGTKGTCKVRVIKDPTAISLPNELYFVKGKQYTITPTFTPSDAWSRITWSSNNYNVAYFNDDILVANAPGECTITAKTTNGLTATAKAIVSASCAFMTNAQFTNGYNTKNNRSNTEATIESIKYALAINFTHKILSSFPEA